MVCVGKDATHKATTRLAKTYRRIGIEDLNVRGMGRNRCLARAIMDGSFQEFGRQLASKARFYGASVVVADPWFASSKTCSCCGSVKAELALSQRLFCCQECGFECDRDHNAALNLERLAASSAVSACGEERSGVVRKSRVKRASKKQEPTASVISFAPHSSPLRRFRRAECWAVSALRQFRATWFPSQFDYLTGNQERQICAHGDRPYC